MPTILTCPSCGKRSQVAQQTPGSAVRCPHCSAVMKVPGEAPRAGTAAPPKLAANPTTVKPASTDRPAPWVPPLLVPLPTEPPDPPDGYLCSVCGGSFPVESVFDQDGAIICEACHAATTGAASSNRAVAPSFPAVPTLSTLMAEPPELPPPVDDHHSTIEPASEEPRAVVSAPGVADAGEQAITGASAADPIADLARAAKSRRRSKRAPTEKPFPLIPVIGLGCGGVIILVAIMLYVTRSPPPVNSDSGGPTVDWSANDQTPGLVGDQAMTEWEKKYAPRLSQWRSTAKGMEVSGDRSDRVSAQLLYQKMLDLAKSPGAAIHNTGVLAELAEAKGRFDALTKELGPPPGPVAQALQPNPDDAPTPTPAPNDNSSTPATSPATTAPVAPVVVVDWEPAHRDEILKLAAAADAFEHGGQLLAAFFESEQLLEVVGDHRAALSDPQLKTAAAAADAAVKRLAASARDSDAVRMISARSLLAAGLKAEEGKKWKTALDNLYDANHLLYPLVRPVQRYHDPVYLAALNGTAVAYMMLKQPVHADQLFADEEPLGRGTLVINAPSREMIWNRAVNDLYGKANIMRSIKMLHDYLDPRHDPDEPLLNLLGTMLEVGDETNPPNRKILDDAIGFYGQRSNDLEKTRNGEKRWGVEWLPEADAQMKYDQYTKAIDAYQVVLRTKTAADAHVKDVEDASRRPNPPKPTQTDINKAKEAAAQVATALKAAKDAIPRAHWLKDVQPMVPAVDLSAPIALSFVGAGGAPTTAPASASPATAPAAGVPTSQPVVAMVPPVIPPARYAAAFPIDRTHLITAADPLGSASSVSIQDAAGNTFAARVAAKSDRLALLEVAAADVGGGLKFLAVATDFSGGPVQCATIPQANIFIPVVTLLTADSAPVPIKSAWWVGLPEHPRLAGSPLVDAQNAVIGVEVAARDDPRQKLPSVTLADLRKFLDSNKIVPAAASKADVGSVIFQVSAQAE